MDITDAILFLTVDNDGFITKFWYPFNLPIDICSYVARKCYSIISEDDNFIPEVLLIFPIPSLKLKALVKYFARDEIKSDLSRMKSAIVYLFDENDDNIYYRYLSYLDPYFQDTIMAILSLESEEAEKERTFDEIMKLQMKIKDLTRYLKGKSEYVVESEIVEEKDINFDHFLKKKYKIVVLGDPSVGKTSTILRFTDNVFLRAYVPTMGLNITQKVFKVDKFAVELRIWDIGGQAKFELVRRQFYEASNGYILLFDLTNPISFAKIPKWYMDLREFYNSSFNLPGFLIGNKLDLLNQRIVKKDDAIKMANSLGLDYFEVSALTGYNIEHLFLELALKLGNH